MSKYHRRMIPMRGNAATSSSLPVGVYATPPRIIPIGTGQLPPRHPSQLPFLPPHKRHKIIAPVGRHPGGIATDTRAAVREFIESRPGLRPQSVSQYGRVLTRMAEALPDWPASASTLSAYVTLRKRAVSETTLHSEWRCICAFSKWYGLEHEDADPTRKLLAPKKPKPIPVTLSDAEAQAVLDAAQDPADQLLVRLILGAGLRKGEVVALTRDHIGPDVIRIPTEGKTGPDTTLTPPGVYDLAQRVSTPNGTLWTTKRGTTATVYALTARYRRLAVLAGLKGKKQAPHTGRHYFCTSVYKRTRDILATKRLARHADIQSTLIYVHTDLEDLRRTWSHDNPLAGLHATPIPLWPPQDAPTTPIGVLREHQRAAVSSRLPVWLYVFEHPGETPAGVARGLGRSTDSAQKALSALRADGLVTVDRYGRYTTT